MNILKKLLRRAIGTRNHYHPGCRDERLDWRRRNDL
jgi:hypothetical protein